MSSALSNTSSPQRPVSSSMQRVITKLQPAIDALSCDLPSLPAAVDAARHLLFLRHAFIDDDQPREAKSAFRQLRGFQVLVGFLGDLAGIYNPESPGEDRRSLLRVATGVLGVLAEGLRDHRTNKQYFASHVLVAGVMPFEEVLSKFSSKLVMDLHPGDDGPLDAEQFYGGLLAAALCQETISDIFTSLRKAVCSNEPPLGVVRENVNKLLGTTDTVENPEFITPLVRLWLEHSGTSSLFVQRIAVPECLFQLSVHSQRNRLALHSTQILATLLKLIADGQRPQDEITSYRDFASSLCANGVNTLADAAVLFRGAHRSSHISEFLLKAIKSSKQPPFFQFDLSRNGYSSVELPTLGRIFPRVSSLGYTLAIWARFDHFDPDAHTTLFGVFDPTHTCFLLCYLEKDTRNLILQTSMKGPRPSVRFKSTIFTPGQWYHICIVHKRPRHASSSRALLFINGEFVEQVKADYPTAPAARTGQRSPRIQAFLGTPQQLSQKIGKGVSSSEWSCASVVLFDDAFNDDVISVISHLGPRYHGNFQDSLGSFQTYTASAALNLRNESLHPGKENSSPIVSMIRQKAGLLVPENSVVVNLSPVAVLHDDDKNNVDESRLIKSLSKAAAKNLHTFTRGGTSVVINGAIPAINEALTRSQGVGLLVGDPIVVVPQSLDDASWRFGGCPAVHLSMVEAASTGKNLRLAVEIMFESIEDSWRNSEAMEKENGYGILAVLLREKLGFPSLQLSSASKISPVCSTPRERNELAMDLLMLILKFVGYNFENPKKSLIVNPLAYRVLLVDLEIWRMCELPLLEIYYSQFRTLCEESHHHRFNARRLARMRVVKRLLEALKVGCFTEESLRLFIKAFKPLVTSSMAAEMLRSVALFITSAVQKTKDPSSLRKTKSMRFDKRRPRRGTAPEPPNPDAELLSKERIGTEILRAYTDILCSPESTTAIKKFAKTVTNKWLLYLICEDNPEVVVLAAKVLARLLVVHGGSYTRKFADKAGGFTIMRQRLKRWWHLRALWVICLAILFDKDVVSLDAEREFDDAGSVERFTSLGELKIIYPEVFPVITGMLQSGLKSALSSLASEHVSGMDLEHANGLVKSSSSSVWSFDSATASPGLELLTSISNVLAEFHMKSQNFRDFAASPIYVEELLSVLYPVVVGSDSVNASIELDSQLAGLSVGSEKVVIQPLSEPRQVLQTTTVEQSAPERTLRRAGSFVLVSSHKSDYAPSSARLRHVINPRHDLDQAVPGNAAVQGVLNVILATFTDQLFSRKDFAGVSLSIKTPPGFVEHRAYFESWLLRDIMSHIGNKISSNQLTLLEPRLLTNLSRFLTQVVEAVFEGWFIDGATPTVDLIGPILEYLQKPEISLQKSVRLCSQSISSLSTILFRLVLLQLSEAEGPDVLTFLRRLAYWQTVLLKAGDAHPEYFHLMSYLLYTKLDTDQEEIRREVSNLWRVLLVQKPAEVSAMLSHASSTLQKRLVPGFEQLVGMDDDSFLRWVNDQRDDLDCFFFGALSKLWDTFVRDENNKTEESARSRLNKRKEKLKQWNTIETASEEIIRKHDITFGHWTSNIIASENLKFQRSLQDQQDDFGFLSAAFWRIHRALRQENGLLADGHEIKWRLDQTEGRSRMRLRIIPDDTPTKQDYRPKRKESTVSKANVKIRGLAANISPDIFHADSSEGGTPDNEPGDESPLDDEFEMIDDPTSFDEDYEDKNRKVMRSLYRGDQVQHVCNIGRVLGLDVHEGLLVLGKDRLYIMDSFFQRSDGEIVNAWQAPEEERDPYIRMIHGEEAKDQKHGDGEHETRSWTWSELMSVSKRRFLLRDVGLEIFFADGRSYLLTLISAVMRDDLYKLISSQSPQIHGDGNGKSQSEDMWRFEALQSEEKTPQFFGSRLVNTVFNHAQYHPATRKWTKGEMSNFHYLMMLNTLAGRTFNDLTQYPVFPWVIADYTSDELDLTDPNSFRDLSKPMGCQTPERVMGAIRRYESSVEMEEQGRAFHYGTHYSSAMIVCWYLIRLQPFVKAYFSIQGETFDHADRLFYSIEKAWESAAKSPGNTDVRELTPEFYYLPDFLENRNKYDFGTRQNATNPIGDVELPPWAKGDPRIFIAKQREALESPYVTKNLHHWIDLIFGFKQTGEAAVEAVNVFHYLTYRGGKDLDQIDDPVQKTSVTQSIHQFGQTPHQIFTKPHPRRDVTQHRQDGLDTAAESLTLLPFPLLESQERVSSLLFSVKQGRLLCSGAFRLNIPPNYDKYMEWGFFDNSVRFYTAETKKLIGHFEHLHVGQLSCALFADSQTLITSGTDCTISVWTYTYDYSVKSSLKSVELVPKASLLGHQTPVTVLAVSRSFSTVLSASKDGKIMLWDLNRLDFVRELPSASGTVDCARINDVTGNIVICRNGKVSLYTLNGALLLEQTVCEQGNDSILSCAFYYEGQNNQWLQRELLFTGHRRGLVNIWKISIRNGKFELELIRQLHHVESARGDGARMPAGITCILPRSQVVYTGDEVGRVYEWDCVLRR